MTYTRDLPYSWHILLENLIEPAHVPSAQHGLQGTRGHAIPTNMTQPQWIDGQSSNRTMVKGLRGFRANFEDRTFGRVRHGWMEFRAPYVLEHQVVMDAPKGTAKEGTTPFSLATICIPTRPGWSRLIVFNPVSGVLNTERGSHDPEPRADEDKSEKVQVGKSSVLARLSKLVPPWAGHVLSNHFLNSDLAFLPFEEHERRHSTTFLRNLTVWWPHYGGGSTSTQVC